MGLLAPKQKGTQAERLNGIKVQSSSYGRPIPRVWGTGRVSPNLLWYGDFRAVAVKSKTKTGGKGGGGSQSGSTTYQYYASMILGVCAGPIVGISKVWKDKAVFTDGGSTALQQAGLSASLGSETQPPWSYLTVARPLEAISYPGMAYAYASNYQLSDSATLTNHTFEVVSATRWGTKKDAHPADIVVDVAANIPGARAGIIGPLTSFRDYCIAAGLFISPVLEESVTAADFLGQILKITDSVAVWSAGQFNIIPRATAALAGNSVTWTPNLTPVYDIDLAVIADDNSDPIIYELGRDADAYNILDLEYLDRARDYAPSVMPGRDPAAIAEFGPRKAEQFEAHMICESDVAASVTQLLVGRSSVVRRQFKITLPETYALIDPGDYVTITDLDIGLDRELCMVLETNEDDNTYSITVEEVLAGAAAPALIARQTNTGFKANYEIPPGNSTTPVIIAPPRQLTEGALEMWLAASGGPNWGGAEVWISLDNTTYELRGKIDGPCRYGVTTTALALASDPQAAGTLGVNISTSGGTIDPANQAEADAAVTLCLVGNEVIAYRDATLTAAGQYTLSYLRRGLYGTTPQAWPAGTRFVRLDGAIGEYGFSQGDVGRTMWMKLRSFNVYNRAYQDLSAIVGTTFVVGSSGALYLNDGTIVPDVLNIRSLPNLLPDAQYDRFGDGGSRGVLWENVPALPVLSRSLDATYGAISTVTSPPNAALVNGSSYGQTVTPSQTAADAVPIAAGRLGYRAVTSCVPLSGTLAAAIDLRFARLMGFREVDGVWDTSVDIPLDPTDQLVQPFEGYYDSTVRRRWTIASWFRVRAGVATQVQGNVTCPAFFALPPGQTVIPPWVPTSSAANGATRNINWPPSVTAPAAAINGDTWPDISVNPQVLRSRINGAWVASSNLVNNTNQLTDGAGLGLTSSWTGTTGRPANLSGLSGTEAIQNSFISVVAGALTGIGTGNLTVVANNQITIDGSGNLTGVGTGTGTQVSNNLVADGVNGVRDAQLSLGLQERASITDNAPAAPTLSTALDAGVGPILQLVTPASAALAGGSLYGAIQARALTGGPSSPTNPNSGAGCRMLAGRVGFRQSVSLDSNASNTANVARVWTRAYALRTSDGAYLGEFADSPDFTLGAGIQERAWFADLGADRDWVLITWLQVKAGIAAQCLINTWKPMISQMRPSQTAVPIWRPGETNSLGADVTANAVVTLTKSATGLYVNCDWQGSPLAGQLNQYVKWTLTRGGVDVTNQASIAIIGAPLALGTINANGLYGPLTAISGSTDVQVRFVLNGRTYDDYVRIDKVLANPPNTGGGGTQVQDTTFDPVSTTTAVAITDVMTVKTGSAGTIAFSGDLGFNFIPASGNGNGTMHVWTQWQYRLPAGSWLNVTAEQQSQFSAAYNGASFEFDDGSLTNSPTQTGLTAATNYEVRMLARRNAASPVGNVNFYGTAGAIGT